MYQEQENRRHTTVRRHPRRTRTGGLTDVKEHRREIPQGSRFTASVRYKVPESAKKDRDPFVVGMYMDTNDGRWAEILRVIGEGENRRYLVRTNWEGENWVPKDWFTEFLFRPEREISREVADPCPKCHGTGQFGNGNCYRCNGSGIE